MLAGSELAGKKPSWPLIFGNCFRGRENIIFRDVCHICALLVWVPLLFFCFMRLVCCHPATLGGLKHSRPFAGACCNAAAPRPPLKNERFHSHFFLFIGGAEDSILKDIMPPEPSHWMVYNTWPVGHGDSAVANWPNTIQCLGSDRIYLGIKSAATQII